MPLCIISHAECLAHDMGKTHPESPARLQAIEKQLAASNLNNQVPRLDAPLIDKDLLYLAHTKNYIQSIYDHSPTDGIISLDADTSMNSHSLNAALRGAGAAILAVDKVMTNEFKAAFCATRPPGHHAESNKAMGFCLFNNVVIAALYAKQKYQLEKVAIVDFDVHHGNGTEEIVQGRNGVLFCSTFQHPFYPFSGASSTANNIINTPLPANSSSTEFRNSIQQFWLPALESFKPQLIIISAGFDAHADDAISQVRLYEHDYQWVTEQIKAVSDKYSEGRIVSVLEGGYDLNSLSLSVVAHLQAMK